MANFTPHGTYTDAELLALLRAAYAQVVATGQSGAFEGQQWTRADLPTLAKEIERMEAKVNAAAGLPAENVVRFVRPVA